MLMPQPSLTLFKRTKRCSLSTSCQLSPCQATCCQNPKVPLTWLNHWAVPPGHTRLPPRLSLTNLMDQQPCSLWLKQATQPYTRWQQPRRNATILLHYSSTASAKKRTKTSKRRSTMTPSQDPSPSLAPTTRFSRSWTSINWHRLCAERQGARGNDSSNGSII